MSPTPTKPLRTPLEHATPLSHAGGRGLYFDDLSIGDTWETDRIAVSEEEIVRFALEWDPHPFHTDRQAAEACVLGQLCASGLHSMLLTYRQFMRLGLFEGTTLAGLGADQLRLLSPVLADDTLRVRVTVAELRRASKPDRGLIKLRLATCNASGTVLLDMILVMLVARRQQH